MFFYFLGPSGYHESVSPFIHLSVVSARFPVVHTLKSVQASTALLIIHFMSESDMILEMVPRAALLSNVPLCANVSVNHLDEESRQRISTPYVNL